MVSGEARALAARFREANAEVMRFAEQCSDADWRRMVPHEGRSVAYLIDHFAFGYRLETKAIQACVTGEAQPLAWDELPPTFTRADLDAGNAARWAANPYPDREETIGKLRVEGEKTARMIENLSEVDLQRTIHYGPLEPRTVEQFVERIMIGHPGMHLPGILQELLTSPRE